MINVDVTKLSSKGQIVIPQEMRKEFEIGEKFMIVKNGHEFILKPIQEMSENFVEDLEFAKRTMDALEKYEKGEFVEMDFDDFLSEAEKW